MVWNLDGIGENRERIYDQVWKLDLFRRKKNG